jgi:hypothetical protein
VEERHHSMQLHQEHWLDNTFLDIHLELLCTEEMEVTFFPTPRVSGELSKIRAVLTALVSKKKFRVSRTFKT